MASPGKMTIRRFKSGRPIYRHVAQRNQPPGGYELSFLENQQHSMPAGFYMNFDLVYGSATASTAIAAAKTAYPVSFPRIFALVNQPEPDTPLDPTPGGVLLFEYAWDSSTENRQELAPCRVGEIIRYKHRPLQDPFHWDNPPYGVWFEMV